jgi:hypothetical protein
MRNEANHGGPAGMVGTEDLSQEDPERNQWCVDTIFPGDFDRIESLSKAFVGEHIGEREIPILEKLPLEKTKLLPRRCGMSKTHRDGLLAVGDVVITTI